MKWQYMTYETMFATCVTAVLAGMSAADLTGPHPDKVFDIIMMCIFVPACTAAHVLDYKRGKRNEHK